MNVREGTARMKLAGIGFLVLSPVILIAASWLLVGFPGLTYTGALFLLFVGPLLFAAGWSWTGSEKTLDRAAALNCLSGYNRTH